jgi:hypothetical protein
MLGALFGGGRSFTEAQDQIKHRPAQQTLATPGQRIWVLSDHPELRQAALLLIYAELQRPGIAALRMRPITAATTSTRGCRRRATTRWTQHHDRAGRLEGPTLDAGRRWRRLAWVSQPVDDLITLIIAADRGRVQQKLVLACCALPMCEPWSGGVSWPKRGRRGRRGLVGLACRVRPASGDKLR